MREPALFTIAKRRNQPSCPSTGKCIKKMPYIYTDIKNKIMSFAKKLMKLEPLMLSKISQGQGLNDLTCVRSLEHTNP